MFYTKDMLTINEGETITGHIKCSPNARNNRDLDIVLDYELKGAMPGKDSIAYKMS